MVGYLPIKCEGEEDWRILGSISQGKHGSVYQACCKAKCDFVLKHQKDKNEYDNEIKVYKHIDKIAKGIVPRVYSNFEYDGEYYIIMEKMDLTLPEAIKKLSLLTKEQELKAKISIQAHLRGLVKILQEYCGVIHNDLHVNNIMCKLNKDSDEPHEMFIDWKIIDLEKATILSDKEMELTNKVLSDYYDIDRLLE